MLRTLVATLLAVSLLAMPDPDPSGSDPTPVPVTRSERWHTIAVQALDELAQTAPPTTWKPFVYGYSLLAVGRTYGWDDPRIPGMLAQLLAVRNPDGGWGTGVARTGLNGSPVPATVSYTVTMAGHVGPALLAAWQAGVLTDREPLSRITQLLMAAGRINTTAGQCVAYSLAGADVGPGFCVHNVNAGVGDYLTQATAAGFGRTGLQKLVVDITRREVASYNATWAGWPYLETQTFEQDPDHNAYSGRSLYFLTYPVGREAVYQGMAAAATDDNGRRAHLQLVATPGGPGSQGQVDSRTTLWCEMGDAYLAEATAYVTASLGDAMRLSQAAAWAAANADAC
jgi:hypothetical protein